LIPVTFYISLWFFSRLDALFSGVMRMASSPSVSGPFVGSLFSCSLGTAFSCSLTVSKLPLDSFFHSHVFFFASPSFNFLNAGCTMIPTAGLTPRSTSRFFFQRTYMLHSPPPPFGLPPPPAKKPLHLNFDFSFFRKPEGNFPIVPATIALSFSPWTSQPPLFQYSFLTFLACNSLFYHLRSPPISCIKLPLLAVCTCHFNTRGPRCRVVSFPSLLWLFSINGAPFLPSCPGPMSLLGAGVFSG